jgi:predicted MFS family arabinose efflux permease
VALGFARFAYSLLLPAMRSDLHWTFAQAGAMNTANAVGYLAGAVAAGPLASRRGSRRPFLAGIGLTAVALLAASLSANFAVLLALRLVAGATGAVAFVAGAGLAARLVADLVSRRSAVLLGTYFAGGGLGIVVSAAVIPPVLSGGGTGSWRWGWVVLGAASIVALAATVAAALHAPEPSVATGQRVLGWPIRRLAPTLVSYALFGAGYIGYVTFVVPYLKSEGAHPGTISLFWALLGAAAVAAAFFWGPVLGQLRGGRGPAVTLAVVTVGALLALPFRSTLGHFTSAVVFGAAFLAVVTAVTDLARRSLPAFQVAPAIAVLTVAFGVGQSVGPVLAGVLSDGPSGVRAGLDVSVALLAAATMVALAQRGPPRPA